MRRLFGHLVRRALGRGSQPAAIRPCHVYAMRMSGHAGVAGTLRRLSPEGDYSQAAIDRHGRRVAFWGSAPGVPGRHVFISDVRDPTCRRLTREAGVHGHPCWWPDSESIVCFSTAGVSDALEWQGSRQFDVDRPACNLFRIDLISGERVQLTTGPWVDERPAVSPSGREIAFVSNRSGRLKLWKLQVSTGEVAPVTSGTALEYRPAFSPCGDRLAYFTLAGDGSHQLAVLDWNTGDDLRLRPRRRFRWAHGPSWFADGERMLFHGLSGSSSRPALWHWRLGDGSTTRLSLPGVWDASHGSVDDHAMWLSFDSRQPLPGNVPAAQA